MTIDFECPYCGANQEVCHDDGFGYEEGILHHTECSECEKKFVFNTYITFDYEAYKADCLNGSPHKYKLNFVDPKWDHHRYCINCGEHKRFTEEEINEKINKEKENSKET
jgi:hypothetical protein